MAFKHWIDESLKCSVIELFKRKVIRLIGWGVDLRWYSWTLLQRYSSSMVKLFIDTVVQLFSCTVVQFSMVQSMVQLFGCHVHVLQLFNSTDVQLYICSVVQLLSGTVQQWCSSTVVQFYSGTIEMSVTHLSSGSRFSSAMSSSSRRLATSHSSRSRSAVISFNFSLNQWFSMARSCADTISFCCTWTCCCCTACSCIEGADSELAMWSTGLMASTRRPLAVLLAPVPLAPTELATHSTEPLSHIVNLQNFLLLPQVMQMKITTHALLSEGERGQDSLITRLNNNLH